MKIAVVQFQPKANTVEENLKSLRQLVIRAARMGAKVIVCPELSLSTYSLSSREEALRHAEDLSDFSPSAHSPSSLSNFYRIAAEFDTHIIWGLVERSVTGTLFNSQVLMCPDGTFESYSKINLFSADWLWATSGKSSPPVRTILVDDQTYKVGLLICRDVRDKSDQLDSFYEPGDADLICLSAGWGKGAFPATAWMNFVKENNVTLAISNRYGVEVPNDFGHGGSCIIDPQGVVTHQGLLWGQDCIVYSEIKK